MPRCRLGRLRVVLMSKRDQTLHIGLWRWFLAHALLQIASLCVRKLCHRVR